jgi:hypothetical protein
VDTGLGDKEDAKFYQRFPVDARRPCKSPYSDTAASGHSHSVALIAFDHAGGNTVRESSGALIPAFPNAAYFVQQGEYEDAASANERTRVSYRRDNFTKLAQVNKWEFLMGDQELLPGISAVVTNGRALPSERQDRVGGPGRVFWEILFQPCPISPSRTSGYDLYPIRR